MEDIVAVAIRLEGGESRYFLTWGRLFDSVDGSRLEELANEAARHVQLDGTAVGAHLCDSLGDAAGERYFYECLIAMVQQSVLRGADREAWDAQKRKALVEGREWYYLGVPRRPSQAR